MSYQTLLNQMWTDYSDLNPSVGTIHKLLKGEGENIVNDHIALRTFDMPGINIKALSVAFKNKGFIEKGSYYFETKKLRAKHFEHEIDISAPKIFISELVTDEFSQKIKKVATEIAENTIKKNLSSEELLLSKNAWGPISFKTYEELREESEYAAWFYVFGFRANHFTVFVNHLKKYKSLESLNTFLKENKFTLNTSGGEIKGTRDELLKQSSTLADQVNVKFIEGVKKIPCCYYEFAERFKNKKGKLFNGFIAKSADKIFESTDYQ